MRLWLIALLWLTAETAFAHSASRSFSSWTQDGQSVSLVFSMDQVQATLLIPERETEGDLEALLAEHLASHLHVSQNGAPCSAAAPEALPAMAGSLQIQIHYNCAAELSNLGWAVRNDAFFDLASTHIHIAQNENDPEQREFIFTDSHRRHVMSVGVNTSNVDAQLVKQGFWRNFTIYIRLGIAHILNGFDHLAFVTALVLLARRHRDLAILVTGFTIGHSVTLSLAALGFIHPQGAAIEALIGFSIAFIGAEILLVPGSRPWRNASLTTAALFVLLAAIAIILPRALTPLGWLGLAIFTFCYGRLVNSAQMGVKAALALTLAFGLIHGAGFASVLGEAGLPPSQRLSALAGFNIGVELGQLAVIAGWLAIFTIMRRLAGGNITKIAQMVLSGVVFLLGVYWFASRALF